MILKLASSFKSLVKRASSYEEKMLLLQKLFNAKNLSQKRNDLTVIVDSVKRNGVLEYGDVVISPAELNTFLENLKDTVTDDGLKKFIDIQRSKIKEINYKQLFENLNNKELQSERDRIVSAIRDNLQKRLNFGENPLSPEQKEEAEKDLKNKVIRYLVNKEKKVPTQLVVPFIDKTIIDKILGQEEVVVPKKELEPISTESKPRLSNVELEKTLLLEQFNKALNDYKNIPSRKNEEEVNRILQTIEQDVASEEVVKGLLDEEIAKGGTFSQDDWKNILAEYNKAFGENYVERKPLSNTEMEKGLFAVVTAAKNAKDFLYSTFQKFTSDRKQAEIEGLEMLEFPAISFSYLKMDERRHGTNRKGPEQSQTETYSRHTVKPPRLYVKPKFGVVLDYEATRDAVNSIIKALVQYQALYNSLNVSDSGGSHVKDISERFGLGPIAGKDIKNTPGPARMVLNNSAKAEKYVSRFESALGLSRNKLNVDLGSVSALSRLIVEIVGVENTTSTESKSRTSALKKPINIKKGDIVFLRTTKGLTNISTSPPTITKATDSVAKKMELATNLKYKVSNVAGDVVTIYEDGTVDGVQLIFELNKNKLTLGGTSKDGISIFYYN
jgi:hypothetical protein